MARRLLSLASIIGDAEPAAQWIRSTATARRLRKEPPENRRRLKPKVMQEILAVQRTSIRNNRMLDLFFLDMGFAFGRPPYSRLKGKTDADWSKAEDEKLLNKMRTVGRSDWSKVAKHVGKPESDCRKRYSLLLLTNQGKRYRDIDSLAVRLHTAIKEAKEEKKRARMQKKLDSNTPPEDGRSNRKNRKRKRERDPSPQTSSQGNIKKVPR